MHIDKVQMYPSNTCEIIFENTYHYNRSSFRPSFPVFSTKQPHYFHFDNATYLMLFWLQLISFKKAKCRRSNERKIPVHSSVSKHNQTKCNCITILVIILSRRSFWAVSHCKKSTVLLGFAYCHHGWMFWLCW